jgi:mycothiol synthase
MSIRIQRVDLADDDALDAYVSIANRVRPEATTSASYMRWGDRTYPGGTHVLASIDGRPVGVASTGRINMYDASYARYWLALAVLPDARRRGVGSALWAAVSDVARRAGKIGFQTGLSEAQADGVAFLLHRRFEIVERAKMVELDLRGRHAPDVAPPAGFEITSLAARPDLVSQLHALAIEAYADIPAADEPIAVGTLDEFRTRDVEREGIPPDGLAIAIETASGRAAGWASLMFKPGSSTAAWHDMTAVGRAYRGRGIATALKRATIRWAIENGLEILETGNDEENAPMRAVNRKLGYQPIPDELTLRGPLAPG